MKEKKQEFIGILRQYSMIVSSSDYNENEANYTLNFFLISTVYMLLRRYNHYQLNKTHDAISNMGYKNFKKLDNILKNILLKFNFINSLQYNIYEDINENLDKLIEQND